MPGLNLVVQERKNTPKTIRSDQENLMKKGATKLGFPGKKLKDNTPKQ